MSRLDDVIKQVKDSRVGGGRAWIFDETGELSDGVIVGEVLDFLEELKEYEVSVTDVWLSNVLETKSLNWSNTYNDNANVTNAINYGSMPAEDGGVFIIARVHLRGDIRSGYSDFFVVKMEEMNSFYWLDSVYQYVPIDERYTANVCIFEEGYDVYDTVDQKDVGEFYEIEKEDLLKEIKEA